MHFACFIALSCVSFFADEVHWNAHNEVARVGDFEVAIIETSLGKVTVKDAATGKEYVTETDLVLVKIIVTNVNDNRKVNFSAWSSAAYKAQEASLHDNFGNDYDRMKFKSDRQPDGAGPAVVSFYPRKSLHDTIAFEPPINTATHLDLVLPGMNFEERRLAARFRIPLDTVRGSRAFEAARYERIRAASKDAPKEETVPERTASAIDPAKRLAQAKALLPTSPAVARRWLREIMEKHPNTPEAREAKTLLAE